MTKGEKDDNFTMNTKGALTETFGSGRNTIGKGIFLIETKNGKFIYAFFGDNHNAIVVPRETLSMSRLVEISLEVLSHRYCETAPQDYNFIWDDDQCPPKKAVPNVNLLAKTGILTLISKEPFFSDKIYPDRGVPKWGRVEIEIKSICDSRKMETITVDGEHLIYNFPSDSLVIETTSDLSWDGSPEKDTEFHYLEGVQHSTRKYSTVQNKEESNSLISLFGEIVKRIIAKDEIIAISIETEECLKVTLEEAKNRYNILPVTGKKSFTFKDGKRIKDNFYEKESSYYFTEGNMTGLLINDPVFGDRIMFPYLVIRNNLNKNVADTK